MNCAVCFSDEWKSFDPDVVLRELCLCPKHQAEMEEKALEKVKIGLAQKGMGVVI